MSRKVFFITGGASGMGYATAQRVVEEGQIAVIADINEEALRTSEQQLNELARNNGEALALKMDVSDEESVRTCVADIVKRYGRIDAFFNNAGIDGKQSLLTDYPQDIFKKVIDINLKGVFYGLKHVLKVMEQQKSGSIVNTASALGLLGSAKMAPYVASKHAVAGLTKSAAADYGHLGIRVNAVAPGGILTPMVAQAFKQMNPENPEEAERKFAANTPLKRFGKPEEVTDLVWFLLSDNAGYINGQVIAIDGGQTEMYRELMV